MKKLLLFFFLIIFFTSAKATTFEFNTTCREAYREIFNLNFNKVASLLEMEKNKNPENAAAAYLENYADFLLAFISEDLKDFNRFKNKIDARLRKIDQLPNSSPWKKMARGEMLLQYAVVKFKWKENFSAAYYFRKSFKLLEENQRQFSTFSPNLKSLGFFHAAIGTVPENYKWLANLVGLRGSINQGAGELDVILKKVKNDNSLIFMFDEVAFLRIFVATHFEKDFNVASRILNDDRISDNNTGPLHAFIKANTSISEGKQAVALEILSKFKSDPDSYPLIYLEYMKGMLMLNKLDLNAASHFTKYVDSFKGASFVKSAWHKLAWIQFLRNDMNGFHNFMGKVKTEGNDFTDEDKQAMKDAVAGEVPNKFLLRSRLLFDGGNYLLALTELTGAPDQAFVKFKDQVEFTYRIARIFDKQGQKEKAIQFYETTYDNGRNHEWYFAANAALLNGLIYEEKNDTTKAREWFRKALSLRNHEYQNSIDQKAEAGLNRMMR